MSSAIPQPAPAFKTARTIKPEPKARDAYEAHYRRYASIYPAIKEIYR